MSQEVACRDNPQAGKGLMAIQAEEIVVSADEMCCLAAEGYAKNLVVIRISRGQRQVRERRHYLGRCKDAQK